MSDSAIGRACRTTGESTGPAANAANAAVANAAVGCPSCGLIQIIPARIASGALHCTRCDTVLERTAGRSLTGALACSSATLLLLLPANVLPLLQVHILSITNTSVIASGVAGVWRQDWPATAVVIGLEIVALPFLRFGLLTLVLATLKLGRRPAWLGPAFRWSEWLDQWAMLDVFLFGGFIGYSRVAPFLPIGIGPGGWCFIAAAFFTFVTRASLERRVTWRLIRPSPERIEPRMIGCRVCDFPVPHTGEGKPCPRCGAKIWRQAPLATMRALALTAAGFIFYPAAYLYPMEYNDRLGTMHGYTVMTGVTELAKAGLWFFAAVIFVASIVIPLLKLVAFAWFGVSIHYRSAARLRFKTRLYRVIAVIGRWSHIDPFTVTVFLPLMHVSGLLSIVVGRALPAFLAIVVLTMIATEMFDPRALWIAGGADGG